MTPLPLPPSVAELAHAACASASPCSCPWCPLECDCTPSAPRPRLMRRELEPCMRPEETRDERRLPQPDPGPDGEPRPRTRCMGECALNAESAASSGAARWDSGWSEPKDVGGLVMPRGT